jgi:hypothetical protein
MTPENPAGKLVEAHRKAGIPCAVAECSREQLFTLKPYDHHTVRLKGEKAVMLTYHLLGQTFAPGEQPTLVFALEYADNHPPAPSEVQDIINTLHITRV